MSAAPRHGPMVVVGDSLLDIDLEGDANRLSPEAPVPVVDITRQRRRPGGAGLAALLAARSGQDVILITAIGSDDLGDTLLSLLVDHVEVHALPLDGRTVCKCRIAAREVPMLRLDSGVGRAACSAALPQGAVRALALAGAILVSDYGRGLAEVPAIQQALLSKINAVPVVWDPHPRGPAPVRGCTLVTPNVEEARSASGADHPEEEGRRLCADWQARAVAVTLGRRGAVLTETEPPRTTQVPVLEFLKQGRGRIDACGAGDQFAVAAAAALLEGADTRAAVQAAVTSATQFVRDGGAAAVSTISGLETGAMSLPMTVRAGTRDAFEVADRVRRAGGRLVATGGCFDLLHRGHISLLNQARALGDALVVCLNSDASVRRAKGADRPVVPQEDRAQVRNALAAVDGVAIFDERTPASLLARLRPDMWVKGEDYANRMLPEAEVVERNGGTVVLLPLVPGYSTSRLVSIAQTNGRDVHPDISKEVS